MSRQWRSDDTAAWTYAFGNGSDGAKTVSSNETYDGANAGCSGTSGSTSLTLDAASTFANEDLVLIHQTRGTNAGNWELNKIASGGGTTSITLAHTLQNTYADSGADQAQIVELKQYSSVTVDNGFTWSATTWDGSKGGIIAFLCNGTVSIAGTISASEKGFIPSNGTAGQSGGNSANSNQAEGSSSAGASSSSANGSGAGGVHGTSGDAGSGGSGGGHANSGTAGQLTGDHTTTGGSSVGTASLTNLQFGGAGSGAKGESSANSPNTGNGGNGGRSGGIVAIFAITITVTGSVVTNGQNGFSPTQAGFEEGGGGGGGGAGGAVLFKGTAITIGTNLVTVAAGSGANGSGSLNLDGGAGSVGRIHADYSSSFSGTTSPAIDTTLDSTIISVSGYAFFM